MSAVLAPTTDPPDGGVLAAAIETDRRYFELGAVLEDLDGGQLAWMPGLSTSPAAVVVQRVEPAIIGGDGHAWLDRVEQRLRELGTPLARIYLDDRDTAMDDVLAARGYVSRDELALAGTTVGAATGTSILRPVDDEEGWQAKRRFHEADPVKPDGHDTPAAAWVEMERTKTQSGGMQSFLLEREGDAVGTIGAVRLPGLLRIKNVMTHPAHRRTGVGGAMLAHLADLARDEGDWGVCIFAVRGDTGEKLYRSVGLEEVGRQVEWSRELHR